ncbi:MAG: hypothetical protein DWQ01_03340 [Planctomycetota bacterium]|nr:MAG: hypothetical protein DWQ01_03340 [Planctomycetota bacterium]
MNDSRQENRQLFHPLAVTAGKREPVLRCFSESEMPRFLATFNPHLSNIPGMEGVCKAQLAGKNPTLSLFYVRNFSLD